MCGGTRERWSAHHPLRGLSPRVRGNLASCGHRASASGSIPACAGEPGKLRASRLRQWVYPRVCGGTRWTDPALSHEQGLSPRVRGNRIGETTGYSGHRSIPACAGEPVSQILLARAVKVYPRVCGGTSLWARARTARRGLSPRVRGNHPRHPGQRPAIGSIPACAGEPRICGFPRRMFRVYPRVCGGTGRWPYSERQEGGLSPRVRGNRFHHPGHSGIQGSIPACAGEPEPTLPIRVGTAVYPRVCGGTCWPKRDGLHL